MANKFISILNGVKKVLIDMGDGTFAERVVAVVQGVGLTASEVHIGQVGGYAFDVPLAIPSAAGALGAGDIVGGYLEVELARVEDEPIALVSILLSFKDNVTPNVRAVLFGTKPAAFAAMVDNAAYTLDGTDVLKVRATLSSVVLGASYAAHGGTVKTLRLVPQTPIIMKPIAGTKKIGVLLIDDTGVTLTANAVQAVFSGIGA